MEDIFSFFNKKRLIAFGIAFFFSVGIIGSYWTYFTHLTSARNSPQSEEITTDPAASFDPAQETTDLLLLEGEYHKGKKDKSQSDKIVAKAKARKDALKSMFAKDPQKALKVAFTNEARQNLPAEAQPYIETEVEMEGIVETINADDFVNKQSTLFHYLAVGDKKITLHLVDKESLMQSGRRAKVRGIQIDDEVAVDNRKGNNIDLTDKPPQTLGITTPVTKKIAVILVNFQNTPSLPFTADQARSAVFTGASSVQAFFNEASFGSWNFRGHTRADGDVFGWITVPYSNSSCNSMYNTWTNNVNSQLTSQGVDVNVYNNRIYILNNPAGCPGAGWAFVYGNVSWIASGLDVRAIAHELGHNYGSHHASSKSCTDAAGQRVSISQNCIKDEYGDPYDVMGASPYHFGNYNKGVLQWYEASNTHTVTSSGAYTIAPLGSNTSAVQALRIAYPQVSGLYYYLEFRRPYGLFENFLTSSTVANGISVRLAPQYSIGQYSYLLDMTPSTITFIDAPLAVGKTFTDAQSGISFTTESVSYAEARVNISISTAQCVRGKPTVSVSPLSLFANAGETRTYQVSVTNNDSSVCPASAFTVTPSYPPGWTHTPELFNQMLIPKEGFVKTVSLTSSSGALPGAYSFVETVTHGSDPSKTVSASANYNVNTPPSTPTPTPIAPTTPTSAPTSAVPSPSSVKTPTPTPIGPTQVASDTTPPAINFSSPQHGAQVARKSTVTMSADASDDKGVIKVEFYVDGTLRCTDTDPAYTCSWETVAKPNTNYKLQAKAFDAAGNTSTATIQVTSK